jgi:hypothetical protein
VASLLLSPIDMQVERSATSDQGVNVDCGCDPEKIRAVHAYLREHFAEFVLSDFHAPARLMHPRLGGAQVYHHAVCIARDGVLPYYAVLLNEFQEHGVTEAGLLLRRSDLAGILRANRIAVVSRDGASSL